MGTEPIQYLVIVMSLLRLQLLSLSGNSTIDTNGTKWSDVAIAIAIAVWKRAIMAVVISFNLKSEWKSGDGVQLCSVEIWNTGF